MSITEKIKTWYRGKHVLPPNDPKSPVVIISPGRYEQPVLAKLLHGIGRFWLAHWKWIVSTIIAIAVALSQYLRNN